MSFLCFFTHTHKLFHLENVNTFLDTRERTQGGSSEHMGQTHWAALVIVLWEQLEVDALLKGTSVMTN